MYKKIDEKLAKLDKKTDNIDVKTSTINKKTDKIDLKTSNIIKGKNNENKEDGQKLNKSVDDYMVKQTKNKANNILNKELLNKENNKKEANSSFQTRR